VHQFTTKVVKGLPDDQSIYYVYTPPNYDPKASTKYPVLYLLHGWSDTAGGWTNVGHADNILDNLIAQGKAKPMIVVMPLGYGDMSFLHNGFGVWRDPAAIDHNLALFSQALLTEVVPQAEKLYNVSPKREDHAIAGLSMGGLEALSIGLANPQKFAWVGGFSAAVHAVKPETVAAFNPKAGNLKLVYISVGLKDDLLAPDRAYAAALRAAGQPVTTMEREHLGHVWQEWRPDLALFASSIFK
jgi:enterochelin esterase family protein